MKFNILILVLVVIYSHCANSQPSLKSNLDHILTSNFQPNQPGTAVLVYEKDKIRYQNQAGLANTETKQPITSTTTFRMASVSKQFTAMGILLLEKQKKLKLTDKLSKYFPTLKPKLADQITLTHLLTHTSGIPDYESLMDSTWKRQLMDEDIPALLQNQTKGHFNPGSKFKYSNTGFCMLALIVQQVSGLPYAQFMKESIFDPLGMKHTFIYDNQHSVSNRGMGYTRRGRPSRSPKNPGKNDTEIIPSDQSLTSATKGDGCVYTCTEDYLKWYQALKSNRLVNLQAKLTEIGHLFPKGNGEGYGLGWFFKQTDSAGHYEMTHTGSTCGFSNVVLQVPDKDLLIVYFSNIAGNHAVFEGIQAAVKKHTAYQWKVDWNGMHGLTD